MTAAMKGAHSVIKWVPASKTSSVARLVKARPLGVGGLMAVDRLVLVA